MSHESVSIDSVSIALCSEFVLSFHGTYLQGKKSPRQAHEKDLFLVANIRFFCPFPDGANVNFFF